MEYLPFEIDVLPDKIIQKAEVELGENKETRNTSVKEMRKKIKEKSNLHCPIDDWFLLQFLRAAKFNVKNAMASLHNYFYHKKKYHSLFRGRDYEMIMKVCYDKVLTVLPYRDEDGSVITVCRLARWNAKEIPFDDLLHALTCCILGCVDIHEATQICGLKIIIDVKDFTLEQLLRIKPRYLQIMGRAMTKGIPIRLKGYHIFNENGVIKYAWNIIKFVLSDKIRNRVHFHSSSIKSLHSAFNPKLLPEELGGSLVYDDSFIFNLLEQQRGKYYEMLKYGYK